MPSFPTTDTFNRADADLHGTNPAADAHGWFTNGAVSADLQIASNQVVSAGSGWCQALQDPIYSIPAYASIQFVTAGFVTFSDVFSLVIFAQATEPPQRYDQDYTGYTLIVSPTTDADPAVGSYVIGYGGNHGDGRTVEASVEGTLAVNDGDYFALTVEAHPSDATKVRITGWRNDGGGYVEIDHLDETIANLEATFPTEFTSGYDNGYIGLRIFSQEFVLDNWGGGALAASPTVTSVAASAPASVPAALVKVLLSSPAGSAPASAPVPVAKILLSPPVSTAGPTTVSPPSLTIDSSATPVPAAAAPATVPIPGTAVSVAPPAAASPASAPVPVPLVAAVAVASSAPASAAIPAIANSGTAVTLTVAASTATATTPVPAPTAALVTPSASAPASGTVTVNPETDPPAASAPASAPVPGITYSGSLTAVPASAPATVPLAAPTVSLAPSAVTAPASIPTVVFNLRIVPPRATAPATAPVPVLTNVGAGVTLNIPAASAPATGRRPTPTLGPDSVAAAATPTGGVPTQVGHFLRLDSATETAELVTAASTATLLLTPAAHGDL